MSPYRRSCGFISAALGALLLFSGCLSHEYEPEYGQIAGQLERGGSCYSIRLNKYLYDSFRNYGTLIVDGVEGHELQKSMIRNLAPELWKLSGLPQIKGVGKSSVRISGEKFFRNRNFLLLDRSQPSILADMWGENRDLRPTLAAIPGHAQVAIVADVRLDGIVRVLRQNAEIAKLFESPELTAKLGGLSIDELAEQHSGEMVILVFGGRDPSLHHFVFVIPDHNNQIFALAKNFAGLVKGTAVDGDYIRFGELSPENPDLRPTVIRNDDSVTICSGPDAEILFAADAPALIDTPEFKKLSVGVPLEGCALSYSNGPVLNELITLAANSWGIEIKLDDKDWLLSSFMVLSHQDDGLLSVGGSNWDLNETEFYSYAVIPLLAAGLFHDELLALCDTEDAEICVNAPSNEEMVSTCQEQLLVLSVSLEKYAETHDGKFPEGSHDIGLRELFASSNAPTSIAVCPGALGSDVPAANPLDLNLANTSFLYFGGFTTQSNPKLPLLADWPLNHPNVVNVLLIDGSLITLKLDNLKCKHMIGQLQSMFQYSEEDFASLMKQAAMLDNLFLE